MTGVIGWCSANPRSHVGSVSAGTKALETYGRNRKRNRTPLRRFRGSRDQADEHEQGRSSARIHSAIRPSARASRAGRPAAGSPRGCATAPRRRSRPGCAAGSRRRARRGRRRGERHRPEPVDVPVARSSGDVDRGSTSAEPGAEQDDPRASRRRRTPRRADRAAEDVDEQQHQHAPAARSPMISTSASRSECRRLRPTKTPLVAGTVLDADIALARGRAGRPRPRSSGR